MPAPPSCFAAIPITVPSAVLALQDALPPELRRIHPEDMHLTVAYFGRIDPALHPVVLEALAAIRFDSTPVVLGTLLSLPSREYPSAITLTLEKSAGHDQVVSLMTEHRPALLELTGRPPEDREPLPHITFARPRGRQMSTDKRAAILAWVDAQPALSCPLQLDGLVLMRSRPPRDEGPHYEKITPGLSE
jgi:2'-5' RNA ligase